MEIKAAEISAILKEQIANFGAEADVAEVGQVISVGDGVARVSSVQLGPNSGRLSACEAISDWCSLRTRLCACSGSTTRVRFRSLADCVTMWTWRSWNTSSAADKRPRIVRMALPTRLIETQPLCTLTRHRSSRSARNAPMR